MDQKVANKPFPTLTITAIITFGCHIICVSTALLMALAHVAFEFFWVVLLLSLMFFTGTVILIVFSKKEGTKTIRIPIFVLNFLIFAADGIAVIFGGLRALGDSIQKNARDTAYERATIAYVKKGIRENGLVLQTESVLLYDDDSVLADRFNSIEFTLEYSYCDNHHVQRQAPQGTYFSINGTDACFSEDFRYITFTAESGGLFSPYAHAVNKYSMSEADAQSFGLLVHDQLVIQEDTKAAIEAEVKASMTFPLVKQSFEEETDALLVSYTNRTIDTNNCDRKPDNDRTVLNALKQIDESTLVLVDEVPNKGNEFAYYRTTRENTCTIIYYFDSKTLAFRKGYVDYRGEDRTATVCYKINSEEDNNSLAEAFIKVASERI